MNGKELRKLSRMELLELLLVQTKELENLRQKLERTEAALTERYLRIQEAGNLAQAVLVVNGVMEAAQASAQQYLENIAVMESEAKTRCEEMLAEARKQAEQIVRDARERGIVPEKPPVCDAETVLIAQIHELVDEETT